MIEDAEVAEGAKEDAAERGDDLGVAEPMWPLERIEPFVRALENDAVEYGGEWDPIWWAGNPKPDPFAPIDASFIYDCHGEKPHLGDDFAVEQPPDYYSSETYYYGDMSPVRYRAFGFRDASAPDEPTKPEVITFGRVREDDWRGGCAMSFDASRVWRNEFSLDGEGWYQSCVENLELLKAIEIDEESRSDEGYVAGLLDCFCDKFGVPFIPNEETWEMLDVSPYGWDGIADIIEFDDETRSEIRATIELLERWLKVRRRALDEGKPIPLSSWGSGPLSEDYQFSGPKELSDREREAVSLYAERPYKPQWRGDNSCPPEEILLEIERKLGPAESDLWRPKKRPKKRPENCTDTACDGSELDDGSVQTSSSVSRGVDGVKAAVGKKLIAVGKKLLGE